MGISEQNEAAEKFHYNEEDESDAEECDSDDSQDDPTFDVVEETRSRLSMLCSKRKSKSHVIKEMEEGNEEDPDVVEMAVPKLGEEDQKSFEVVQKIIEAGQVEKLKVDQCKVYLRKHGLRLTGNKDTLIERIKEHLDILRGGGEKKYPISNFVLNCKGDSCTGDVVMFEQNVYEMFNIASRSASGPPCGKRIVAGRIVKESYGAAKQQHTFTIEVLWSEGEKPLPPLYPLLIKGRNLYRLKTMRQRWENESERQKMLSEKHARGSLARSNREARIQLKEMKKANRASRMEDQNRKQKETKVQPFQSLSIGSEKLISQPQEQQKNMQKSHQDQKMQQKENTSVPLETLHGQPGFFPNVNVPSNRIHQWQHLTSMPSRSSLQSQNHEPIMKSIPSQCLLQRRSHEQSTNGNPFRRPLTSMNGSMSPLRSHNHEQSMNSNPLRNPFQKQGLERSVNPNSSRHVQKENMNFNPTQGPFQRQICRFYAQGRCHYGDHCKYLHECRGNQNYGERNYGRSDLRYY